MSFGKQLFYLPQGMFASETGFSLSNSLEVPLKRIFTWVQKTSLPFWISSVENPHTIVSPLYQRKFDLRFTEVIGSEQQCPKVVGLKSFCQEIMFAAGFKQCCRNCSSCRGHSCGANLADTITLFFNYTDNNTHTLKLLDKILLYMGQHSFASPRHKA